MNTDRFLTRVWDRLEKKMIYLGDGINSDRNYFGVYNDKLITELSVTNFTFQLLPNKNDRFIPMLCLGATDMIKQIIYEDDLIMIPEGLCQVKLGSMFNWHFSEIKESGVDYMITPKLLKCSNVMGNKWENSELMEESK